MLDEYIKKGIVEEKTVVDILTDMKDRCSEKTAVVDAYRRVSYGKLWENAERCACIFYREGLRKGDHVLLWMNNRIEFTECLFGLMRLGVVPVMMLPNHRMKEIETLLAFSGSKAIITYGTELGFNYAEIALEAARKASSEVKVFTYEKNAASICMGDETSDLQVPEFPMIGAEDTALFLLSGGTTGIPKMIPKKHAAYYYNARYTAARCRTNEDSVYLAALSIAHDYPLSCPGVLGTLMMGGKVVLSLTSSFDEVGQYIESEGVTFTQIAPSLAAVWLECMEWEDDVDLSSLKYIEIGAAKLELSLAQKIEEKFGVDIIQGYGLGEGITCFTDPDDPKEIAWTCQGKPISEYDEVKITDEDGNEVAQGCEGELTEKGPYTFEGYYHADELNRQVFTEDGFFKTGDKAKITPEGNILILGRVREQINRAGENVIPSEIEQYLKECSGIRDAAVFGLPDEELGEKICAVLIADEKKDLKVICEELSNKGLAAFKTPDTVFYVDRFPIINVGKIDKKALREQCLNGGIING